MGGEVMGIEMVCGVVGIEMGWGEREGGMQKNANVLVLRIRYSVNILHTSLVASNGNLNSTGVFE